MVSYNASILCKTLDEWGADIKQNIKPKYLGTAIPCPECKRIGRKQIFLMSPGQEMCGTCQGERERQRGE